MHEKLRAIYFLDKNRAFFKPLKLDFNSNGAKKQVFSRFFSWDGEFFGKNKNFAQNRSFAAVTIRLKARKFGEILSELTWKNSLKEKTEKISALALDAFKGGDRILSCHVD